MSDSQPTWRGMQGTPSWGRRRGFLRIRARLATRLVLYFGYAAALAQPPMPQQPVRPWKVLWKDTNQTGIKCNETFKGVTTEPPLHLSHWPSTWAWQTVRRTTCDCLDSLLHQNKTTLACEKLGEEMGDRPCHKSQSEPQHIHILLIDCCNRPSKMADILDGAKQLLFVSVALNHCLCLSPTSDSLVCKLWKWIFIVKDISRDI